MLKKRKANHFKPSVSLAEFAEAEGLSIFSLSAVIADSPTIKSRFSRGVTKYYHIVELRAWLANNEVSRHADVQS